MSTGSALVLLFAGAITTYAARAGLIVALADRSLPPVVERALAHVGPAVLAALAVSLAVGGEGIDSLSGPEAAAIVAAGLVAVRTRNLIWTFVGGLGVLLLLEALV
ncbi:MAG: AzlD domain-containing protein [Actinomycetota bacterium]